MDGAGCGGYLKAVRAVAAIGGLSPLEGLHGAALSGVLDEAVDEVPRLGGVEGAGLHVIKYGTVLAQPCLRVEEAAAPVVCVQLNGVELWDGAFYVVEGLACAREELCAERDHSDRDMGQ